MKSARPASVVVLALVAAACAGTRGGAVPEPASVSVPSPEAPPAASAAVEADVPAAPADPRNYLTYTIKVNGMTCPIRCVREVRDFLKAVPGVLHVEIDYDSRTAIVDVTPGTAPETVIAGLKGNYTGRLVK